jgi:PKD repeat protein
MKNIIITKAFYWNKKNIFFYALAFVLVLFSSCKKEEDVQLSVDFVYEVLDTNYTVPAHILFTNQTQGATYYKWTFEGGSPGSFDKREPGAVTFNNTGIVKIKLEAWNDIERKEKEITILLDSVVTAGFNATPIVNDFAPVDYKFTNTSLGASQYNWQFPGALNTLGSTEKNPLNVRYITAGLHRVYLQSLNARGRKDTISKLIRVRPTLSAAFAIEPSFDDIDDYEAPLIATLKNNTISATIHNWQAPGGILSSTTDSIPNVTYNTPGTYTVTYMADNGKQTQTITQSIIVKPNTGMRTFTNVKFGINSADASLGCYFSTMLRQTFKSSEVNNTNGTKIDLCFFGLSNNFTFNKFISPDSVQLFTFPTIANASHTNYINLQESCGCGLFTVSQFDNAVNGTMLNTINVPTIGGGTNFSNAVIPRIVLFLNQQGKKGAIKIKQFVNDGLQSYILCDIKVQKD